MQTERSSDSPYSISSDKDRLDVPLIHRYLSQSAYWARGCPLDTVIASIKNSLCFGVFSASGKQVGFARVVTDYSTFAWLCDVFILEEHRRRGLGKRLVESVINHPDLARIRRILLATSDAYDLYRRYGGFQALEHPDRWMEKLLPVATAQPEAA